MTNLVTSLIAELEAPKLERKVGQGWIAGVLSLLFSISAVIGVLCLIYPQWFSTPEVRSAIDLNWFRPLLHGVLIVGFVLACISLILRQNKLVGLVAMGLTVLAVALGGSHALRMSEASSDIYLGLDWFVLNLVLTGLIFLPLERLFRLRDQSVFRFEWREDLLYFLISSVMVQSITFLSFMPSLTLQCHPFKQRLSVNLFGYSLSRLCF